MAVHASLHPRTLQQYLKRLSPLYLKRLSPLARFSQERQTSSTTHKVLISRSQNIHENLALEDWLYQKADLETNSILLLWRNHPAIVFGRHQNPWVECNIKSALKHEVDLVRRRSGGGTVFHDLGNLNCSFVKKEQLYNRKANLELVVDAIRGKWDVNLSINCNEDILLDSMYKLSGTASRLSGKRTYHHFTLLMDVDPSLLNTVLHSDMIGVSTTATPSRRSQVSCLKSAIPDIEYHSLVDVISTHFLQCGGSTNGGVESIDPLDEDMFPGVSDRLRDLRSWDWTYGKTPPFSIHRKFQYTLNDTEHGVEVDIAIKKGLIHTIELQFLRDNCIELQAIEMLKVALLGAKLQRNVVMSRLSQLKMDWISAKLYDVRTCFLLDWLVFCIIQTLHV